MDSTLAQLQIRQNAMEAQECMQDLHSWQQSMKAKAGSQQQRRVPERDVPAVRGRASGSAPIQPAPLEQQQPALQPGTSSSAPAPPPAAPAAHTYKNYSKWDRFDVDAAMQEAEAGPTSAATATQDQRIRAATSDRQQQEEGENPLQPRQANAPISAVATKKAGKGGSSSSSKGGGGGSGGSGGGGGAAATAAALKDRGNQLYQAGYWDEAVACYSQSIEVHPTAVAYANRAMARLKQRQYADAASDCDAALQLDPGYVKALHRRGTARLQLGCPLEAAGDFEAALCLEPANAGLRGDRDRALKQHLDKERIQASTTWHSISVVQQPEPQPPQQQPQAQAASPEEAPSKQQQEHTAGQCGQEQQQQPRGAEGGGTAARPAGATPLELPPAAGAAAAPANSRAATPTSGGGSSGGSGRSPQLSPQQASSVAAAAEAAASRLTARLSSSLKPPKTGHEFEAAWRSLRGDMGLQAKYLRLVQPQQLPVLFRSSLTAQLLVALLTATLTSLATPPAPAPAGAQPNGAIAAASHEEGQVQGQQQEQEQLSVGHALGLIQGLVKVPRFDMMAMCLSSRDKAALRQLWDAAAAAVEEEDGAAAREQLAAVRPKFRL